MMINRRDLEREMDVYIGKLLNETTMNIAECLDEFLKKYPKEERHFDEFFLDYTS